MKNIYAQLQNNLKLILIKIFLLFYLNRSNLYLFTDKNVEGKNLAVS